LFLLILFIESACALSSIFSYRWYGLFAFDTSFSETVQLLSAALTDPSATSKVSSAMLQHSSADLKAAIVTVEEVIAELTECFAADKDPIAAL